MKLDVSKDSTIRVCFYSLWTAISLILAYFTELIDDEAYYWLFSKNLDWGYFDHPPAIAVMINIGYSLFQNELGVRLLPILSTTATIWIWEKTIQPQKLKLFYLIILSIGILHVIGTLATPDVPLFLSSAIFFWAFKKFLDTPNFKWAVLLSISIAMMLLSKYHGIIIIGCTILSQLQLFKEKMFWWVPVLSIIFLSPHMFWQINFDFPSLKFHLLERSETNYHIRQTLEYIITQPFVLGPFTGVIFWIAAISIKTKTHFEKSLKWVFWGVHIFFLLMTSRGFVEAHWLLISIFPSIYFGYLYLENKKRLSRIFTYLSLITLLGMITIKLLLLKDWTFENSPIRETGIFGRVHNRTWITEVKQQVADTPVAFLYYSFQAPSLYSFYTSSEAFPIYTYGRKSQFNLWRSVEKNTGKKIIIVENAESSKRIFRRIDHFNVLDTIMNCR